MISIIIPSRNRADTASATLASLFHQNLFFREKCEIIVSVDDDDEQIDAYRYSLQQLKTMFSYAYSKIDFSLLLNEKVGAAQARNNAIKISKGDYIFVMDDDILLEREAIEKLYADIRSVPHVGAVSGFIVYTQPAIHNDMVSEKVIKAPEEDRLQFIRANADKCAIQFGKREQMMDWTHVTRFMDQRTRYLMDYFSGYYLFSRKSFDSLNGYNENLGSRSSLLDHEDFTYRMNKLINPLYFNPFIRAWHLTTAKGGNYRGLDYKKSKRIIENDYQNVLKAFTDTVIKS